MVESTHKNKEGNGQEKWLPLENRLLLWLTTNRHEEMQIAFVLAYSKTVDTNTNAVKSVSIGFNKNTFLQLTASVMLCQNQENKQPASSLLLVQTNAIAMTASLAASQFPTPNHHHLPHNTCASV